MVAYRSESEPLKNAAFDTWYDMATLMRLSAVPSKQPEIKQSCWHVQSDVPVVIDFWASWCGPCKLIDPLMKKLDVESNGKLKVIKIEVDGNPTIVEKYGVCYCASFCMLLFLQLRVCLKHLSLCACHCTCAVSCVHGAASTHITGFVTGARDLFVCRCMVCRHSCSSGTEVPSKAANMKEQSQ
jgi:hypothetical protein